MLPGEGAGPLAPPASRPSGGVSPVPPALGPSVRLCPRRGQRLPWEPGPRVTGPRPPPPGLPLDGLTSCPFDTWLLPALLPQGFPWVDFTGGGDDPSPGLHQRCLRSAWKAGTCSDPCSVFLHALLSLLCLLLGCAGRELFEKSLKNRKML